MSAPNSLKIVLWGQLREVHYTPGITHGPKVWWWADEHPAPERTPLLVQIIEEFIAESEAILAVTSGELSWP